MKLSMIMTLIPVAATTAFVISSSSSTTQQLVLRRALQNTSASSEAIQAAMEASKTFGPASPEARVAWDTVEEINASDNSAATTKIPSADTECLVDAASAACLEYNEKMQALQKLLDEQVVPKMNVVKSLASEIQAIKMQAAKTTPASSSPALKEALQNAKDTETKFGKGSPESILAWSELEEIASAGLGNAIGVRLDEECLVDQTLQACTALEELNRAIASVVN